MTLSEQQKQRFLKEQQLIARLQRSASRMEVAEQERIWAIVTAHSDGLSIRKIAVATGLSSSRVHQLLHAEGTKQIAQVANTLSMAEETMGEQVANPETFAWMAVQQQISRDGEILHLCIQWLEQLERGECEIVNLCPPSDPSTSFMSFEQSRIIQVLKQIAGNLDKLSGQRATDINLASGVQHISREVKCREELTEPEPQLLSLSQQPQQDIWSETLGQQPLQGS
jgi:lambda repressor-like predicted transcriptional regulator